jgi:hypothetical protein
MNASQMDKEFEIAYESIASSGGPGYTEYEKSILLTQAQQDIIQNLVQSGIESNDIRSLVIGPHIKTATVTAYSSASAPNPTFSDDVQVGDSITYSWDAGDSEGDFTISNAGGSTLNSTGSVTLNEGQILTVEVESYSGGTGTTVQIAVPGAEIMGDPNPPSSSELFNGSSISYTAPADSTIEVWVNNSYTGASGTLSLSFTIETPTFSESAMYSDNVSFELDSSAMWLIVNERVKDLNGIITEVNPIDNPFKKPASGRFFWRVLQFGDTSSLYTTPNFVIVGLTTFDTYYINYLKKPTPIIVPGITAGTVIDGITVSGTAADNDIEGIGDDIDIVANGLDCGFNSLIHRDIVTKAARLGAAYASDPESLQLLLNSLGK